MKKSLTVLLLVFFFLSASAQHHRIIDIEGSYGSEDTTIYEWEWGAWSSAWSLSYKKPNGLELTIEQEMFESSCWNYLPLSDSWLAGNNYDSNYYINMIIKYAMPKLKNTPDPSLQWLLEVYSNQSEINDTTISWKSSFSIHWINDTLHIPANYSLLLKTDSLFPELAENGYKKALLSYSPSIHNYSFKDYPVEKEKVFEESIKTDYGTIYSTGNGIVLKKGKKYRWLFINDGTSARYRGKLRWAPISHIMSYNHYLAFTVCSAVDFKVYVINIENNTVYLVEDVLENTVLHDWSETWKLQLQNNHLFFTTPHGELKVPLSKFE